MSNIYKQAALDALRGNWKTAMVTGFVASMFGATTIYSGSNGGRSASNSDNNLGQDFANYFSTPAGEQVLGIVFAFIGILILLAIVSLFIGGAVRLGYARFNLNLIDRKQAVFQDLFSQMDRKWVGFCMNFLTGLYISLWSILLVIPGIVKAYSYAMTPFILSENSDMTPNEAITESRKLMDGHKWDLFCLYLSFLGWSLLVSIPGLTAIVLTVHSLIKNAIGTALIGFIIAAILIILGNIPLQPYMEAANAAFYRSLVANQSSTP